MQYVSLNVRIHSVALPTWSVELAKREHVTGNADQSIILGMGSILHGRPAGSNYAVYITRIPSQGLSLLSEQLGRTVLEYGEAENLQSSHLESGCTQDTRTRSLAAQNLSAPGSDKDSIP